MKKSNLTSFPLLVLAFICFISGSISFSQDSKTLSVGKLYYNLNTDGSQSGVKLSQSEPVHTTFSPEKTRLLSELRTAREQNNLELADAILQKINAIDGVTSVTQQSDPRAHFELNKNIQDPYEPDFNVNFINNVSAWSSAIATVPSGAPGAGNLWVANTHFTNNTDSIKFFYSSNQGTSWNYYGQVWFSFNNDFYHDELDIEMIFDGTNTWLYGVGGLRDYSDGRDKCMLFRINLSVGTGYVSYLNFPGSSNVNNNYYNPRICTDNSNYTSSTYMYIACVEDSLTAGGNHAIKQQYLFVSSLFNPVPTYNYRTPSASGGFFWNNNGTPSRIYVYSDIGYFRDIGGSNNDMIMTVFNDAAYGFNSMYLAWSSDFGSTIGGNVIVAESNPTKDARINFNGGNAYRTGMLSYRRMMPSANWDPMSWNTTTGGTTVASWTSHTIDASNFSTRSCDVAAIRGANNLFKMAYAQDNLFTTSAYYSGWNGSAWSAPAIVSNLQVDSTYKRPRAGYILGGGDDCITLWSYSTNAAEYVSRLCSSTTGIEQNNNQAPDKFSLSQNYPNPFNPSTTIKFSIPRSEQVKLVVYDEAGKVSAELINRNMTAGNYSIDFNAANLSSGVYFYKLDAAEFSDVKKMVLIK